MKTTLILLLAMVSLSLQSQTKHTISGYIRDAKSGETLIGATILFNNGTFGTVSNAYGFYSITLQSGSYRFAISYVGYSEQEIEVDLSSDQEMDIDLNPASEEIDEVIISAKSKTQNVTSTDMGNVQLSSKAISQVPVAFGEADVIKTLKLLPGIQSTGEMSSGISVRGGTRDQNLILLDEANVYSVSHMGGMFSVFNNDALKSVEIYKGNMPAEYGGRLASVLDIRMKEGNQRSLNGLASIGLISSKLTVEAPIVKDEGSFMVSGRRTYLDLITKGAHALSDSIPEVPYNFYDLNLKANYRLNDKNRLFLSGYFGRDVFNTSFSDKIKVGFDWGNWTTTARWNSQLNQKLFMNTTFILSHYDYQLNNEIIIGDEDLELKYNWEASLDDVGGKIDFGYYFSPDLTLKFGLNSVYHDFSIGDVKTQFDTTKIQFTLPKMHSMENALYFGIEHHMKGKLNLSYGVRYSTLQNIGKGEVYDINGKYEITDTNYYGWGELYNGFYDGFEPRFGATYILSSLHSVKFSYSRTRQYLQIASPSISGTPIDVWIPAGPNIKPQIADQVSIGYFRNFFDNNIETSVEVYYKDMRNQVDFVEFANPIMNPQLESELRFGKGRAYGVEILIKKDAGKLNGWISYTFSRSERNIKDIKTKGWYPSSYDTPHDLSIVANYLLTRWLTLSANWVYQSGKPITSPIGRYYYGDYVIPMYSRRNNDRLPAYHRLDVGAVFNIDVKPANRFSSNISVSVYNAYNRYNMNAISFELEDDGITTNAYSISLFPFVFPSVSYTLNF